jgi:predicted nuclease with TOPRIM domain
MDVEINEKRRLLERLLRLEELLEGVRRGLDEYRVEMEKMDFPTVDALEAEVHRVRRRLVNQGTGGPTGQGQT